MKPLSEFFKTSRNVGAEAAHKQATFLELFYDLVYVILLSSLAHSFSSDISATGVIRFVILFSSVWWSWMSSTLYFNLHGEDDTYTRVFMILQMFVITILAVFVHGAFEYGAPVFSITFSFLILIQAFQWWRTGITDPAHRPLSTPSSTAFFIAALIFGFSGFFSEFFRFFAWGVGLMVGLVLPAILMRTLLLKNPGARAQIEKTRFLSELDIERFGLFSIITLGEIFVSVVTGLTYREHPSLLAFGLGLGGVFVAIMMWYLYFDGISKETVPAKTTLFTWIFLHLPKTMAIISTSVAVMLYIKYPTRIAIETHLLFWGSLCLFSLSILLLKMHINRSRDK